LGFIDLDNAVERLVEGFNLRGVPEPMQHEPCGLLRDAEIAGQLRASDAFFVAGDQPNRDEPLPQAEFRILENRTNLDRKALSAGFALVSAAIREIVDLRAAAVWAERPVRPADRAEMLNARLLVRERCGQLGKGVECLQHARLQPLGGI
jgi:hypothetical protein